MQKHWVLALLPLWGVIYPYGSVPRALPWADCFLPLQGEPNPRQLQLALNADGVEGAGNDEIISPNNNILFSTFLIIPPLSDAFLRALLQHVTPRFQ